MSPFWNVRRQPSSAKPHWISAVAGPRVPAAPPSEDHNDSMLDSEPGGGATSAACVVSGSPASDVVFSGAAVGVTTGAAKVPGTAVGSAESIGAGVFVTGSVAVGSADGVAEGAAGVVADNSSFDSFGSGGAWFASAKPMDVHIRPSTNNKLKADLAVMLPKFAKISPKRLTRVGRLLLIQLPSGADAAIHSVTAERALWTLNFPRHAFSLAKCFRAITFYSSQAETR